MNVKRVLIARLKVDPDNGQICLMTSNRAMLLSMIGMEFVNKLDRFSSISIDENKVTLIELSSVEESYNSEVEEMLTDLVEGIVSKMDEDERVPSKKAFLERLNKHIQQFFDSEYGG